MYDKIEDVESKLIGARAKKTAIEAERVTSDNIYKVLIYFDKLYALMNDTERRQLMEALIAEIQVYKDRQPNGQWLKSIRFRLPIIEQGMDLSLDNDERVNTVIQWSQQKPDAGFNSDRVQSHLCGNQGLRAGAYRPEGNQPVYLPGQTKMRAGCGTMLLSEQVGEYAGATMSAGEGKGDPGSAGIFPDVGIVKIHAYSVRCLNGIGHCIFLSSI